MILKDKQFLAMLAAVAALVAACGSSASSSSNVSSDASGDTSTADLNTSKCGKFDDGAYGKKVPWQGYQEGSTVYSCNVCRGGYKASQGQWRLVDGESMDPITPLDVGQAELLTIDGNTFSDHLTGQDLGKQADQTITGWYFCGDAAEIPSMDAVFVIQTAVPDGAFANKAGTSFQALVGSGIGTTDILTLALAPDTTHAYVYCRVGSTINGHACTDPFAK